MGLQQIIVWALFVLAGSLAALSLTVATHKASRERRQRHRDAELTVVRPRPRLLELLDDQDADPALDRLAHGAGHTLDALASEILSKLRGEDRAALVRLLDRRGTLERARHQLRSRSSVRRAQTVAVTGYGRAMAALLDCLQDAVPEVRTAAARGLGRLGAPAARDRLSVRVRHDERLEGRVAAAWALGEVGGEGALAGLRFGLISDQPTLVRTAAAGLGACGAPGERVLRAAAGQSQPWAEDAREASADSR